MRSFVARIAQGADNDDKISALCSLVEHDERGAFRIIMPEFNADGTFRKGLRKPTGWRPRFDR
jgi:hypothetical protein